MNRRIFFRALSAAGFAGIANSYSAIAEPQSGSVTLPVPELVNGSIQLAASVTLPPPGNPESTPCARPGEVPELK